MTSKKCPQCGLINFASAAQCKKCGLELHEQAVPPTAENYDNAINLVSSNGMPNGLKGAVLFTVACVVCAVTIMWAKPYLPEGGLLVIFFLPFAFAGYIVGLIVTNILNVVYKVMMPKSSR